MCPPEKQPPLAPRIAKRARDLGARFEINAADSAEKEFLNSAELLLEKVYSCGFATGRLSFMANFIKFPRSASLF